MVKLDYIIFNPTSVDFLSSAGLVSVEQKIYVEQINDMEF